MFCVKVNLTDSISLSCEVFGEPEPDIKWLKDGALLTKDSRTIVLKKESLMISSFLPKHTGNYSCIRSNNGGVLVGNIWLEYIPLIGKCLW